jgi:hypothetical protein
VRELVIVIPDLYLGESPQAKARRPLGRRSSDDANADADGARSGMQNAAELRGIEHVARFGSRSRLEAGWRAWLANWAGRGDLARAAPASVAAARAQAAAAAANTIWIATPLHLQAGLTTLHVDRRSLLRLAPGEVQELCEDFGRVFGEVGLRLEPLASGEALLSSPATPEVRTVEPARFVDGDVAGALPEGPGSGYLRRLGAEIEMWLHEHPVNQARVARRDLPVSTLWLWGNEVPDTPAARADRPDAGTSRDSSGGQPRNVDGGKPPHVDAFGTDAYLQGLCRLLGIECRAPPDSLADIRADSADAVIVVSVGELWRERGTFLDALNEVDRRFVEPAGRAVRSGTYRKVSVLANDRLTVLAERDHLRLWRRPRSGLEALRWT